MHRCAAVLFALLALLLCACGERLPCEVEYQGKTYIVGTEDIFCEGVQYKYEQHRSGNRYSLLILYPDGSTWWREDSGGMGQGGYSPGKPAGGYEPGDILWKVLDASPATTRRQGNPALAILFLLGAAHAVWPRLFWMLCWGWRCQNAEPSDAALRWGRAVGICVAAASLVLLVTTWFFA